jgi:hypothetical protein
LFRTKSEERSGDKVMNRAQFLMTDIATEIDVIRHFPSRCVPMVIPSVVKKADVVSER